MKKGAKRQIVCCPICGNLKVTLGDEYFRCCGELHKIEEHIASEQKHWYRLKDESLEVVV